MQIKFESIDAIIFDLDDCLVDERIWIKERWEKTIQHVEERNGLVGFGENFWKVFDKRGRHYKGHVDETLEKCGGDPELVGEIVSFFLKQKTTEEPFPGVVDFLEEASKRFRLGIITNGREEIQIDRIERMGIIDYFSSIVCAFEFPKPGLKPYLKGIEELGVGSSRSIYVSHEQQDFNGAKLAGMNTVYVNMFNAEHMENVDIEVSSFSELLSLIRSDDESGK